MQERFDIFGSDRSDGILFFFDNTRCTNYIAGTSVGIIDY